MARVGQTIQVRYTSDQGSGYSFAAAWVVGAPNRSQPACLRWKPPYENYACSDVTVDLRQYRTYRELTCEGDVLDYREGWKDVGFKESAHRREEVDFWEVLTFVG